MDKSRIRLFHSRYRLIFHIHTHTHTGIRTDMEHLLYVLYIKEADEKHKRVIVTVFNIIYKTGISQTGAFAYSSDKAKVLRCSAYCLTEYTFDEKIRVEKRMERERERIESIFITFLS